MLLLTTADGVGGDHDDGVTGDVVVADDETLRGSLALGAGDDGRVQAEGLVDEGVEVLAVLEVLGLEVGDGLELLAQLADKGRVVGELEEEPDEGLGDGVGAGDDGELAVADEVQAVAGGLGALEVVVEDPAEDIRLLGLVLGAVVDAVGHPLLEDVQVTVDDGGAAEEARDPGDVVRDGEAHGEAADGLEDVGLAAVLEQVGLAVEGEVLHDVEGHVAEPLGDVDGVLVVAVDDLEQLGDGGGHTAVVAREGCLLSVAA